MNISLPPALRAWVERQVRDGGFGTASEYIRHLVRAAKDRQCALEESLLAALDEGPAVALNDAEWKRIEREGERRLAAIRQRRPAQARRKSA